MTLISILKKRDIKWIQLCFQPHSDRCLYSFLGISITSFSDHETIFVSLPLFNILTVTIY